MKKLLALFTLLMSMLAATPAAAAIFTYGITVSGTGAGSGSYATLTIDTTAQTATIVGTSINVVMTDSDLATFDPATDTGVLFTADSVSGTYTVPAGTYNATNVSTPTWIGFQLSSAAGVFDGVLRMEGVCAPDTKCKSDYNRWAVKVSNDRLGGTEVPEPGMLGLFGLGLGAAGFAAYRRRKTK